MYDPTSQCNEINHIDCSFEHCDIAKAECKHPDNLDSRKYMNKLRQHPSQMRALCTNCGMSKKMWDRAFLSLKEETWEYRKLDATWEWWR